MKKILALFLVACFSTTLFAQIVVSTEPSNRNAVLEEFTGKTCQYCPDGHKRAQQLMNQYPGKFFAINVHQGGYATGTPNYTTPYGTALASQAGMGLTNTGYPAGTVSRQAFPGVTLMGSSHLLYDRGKWAAVAAIALAQPACLNVAAQGSLDTTTRKLTLLVEVYYTGDATELTNKLTIAMLQNEILGPQTGGSTHYPEMMVGGLYRHMHMLRDFITGQWGVEVSPTTSGSFWRQIFKYDVPEHFNNIEVVQKNLEFVVFVAENQKTIISGAHAEVLLTDAPPIIYTLEASADENGTISSSGNVEYWEGESVKYTFTPAPNYEVEEVFVDGEPMGLAQATSYTFPAVDKDYTIHVTFRLIQGSEFTITASAGENGAISPSGETSFSPGASAEFIFTPDPNYEVEEVFIDAKPMGLAQATSYTFPAVDKDYTIHVTFKKLFGIKDANGVTIAVAPNPVNDQLFVTGRYDKLEIISLTGQILTTAHNQPVVDVNHLAKGIYFVKIQANEQTCTFKVIK